jgi:hypothetical protein
MGRAITDYNKRLIQLLIRLSVIQLIGGHCIYLVRRNSVKSTKRRNKRDGDAYHCIILKGKAVRLPSSSIKPLIQSLLRT